MNNGVDKHGNSRFICAVAIAIEQTKVSVNFQILDPSQATLSIFDRGFLFGDSVYEVIRTYAGQLFTFAAHLKRLRRSADAIHLRLPFSDGEIRQHLTELVASVDKPDCYIRLMVSRGTSLPLIDPPKQEQPTTVAIVGPLQPWPQSHQEKGIRLCTVGVRRNLPSAINPMIKSGNYLNNVIALYEARQKHFDDALMLNAEGGLTESTTSNFFLVNAGVLQTPPLEAGILDGISRQIILDLAKENNIPVAEKPLSLEDAYNAQESFISSTTREIMPVTQLDETRFEAPGAVTRKLIKLYKGYVQKQLENT